MSPARTWRDCPGCGTPLALTAEEPIPEHFPSRWDSFDVRTRVPCLGKAPAPTAAPELLPVLGPRLRDLFGAAALLVWERKYLPPELATLLSGHLGDDDAWVIWYTPAACYTAKHLGHALGACSWGGTPATDALFPESGFVFVTPHPWACGACGAAETP